MRCGLGPNYYCSGEVEVGVEVCVGEASAGVRVRVGSRRFR